MTPDTIAGPLEPCAMVALSESRWRTIERWSPTLFLLGGAGVITHAAVQALEAFTSVAPPPDVFVTVGHLIAIAGLLGLYPALVDRQPWLGRVAAGLTFLALAAWMIMSAGQFLAVAGAVESLSAVLPGVFFVGVLLVTLLAYALAGVGGLRLEDRPAADGLLLLAPAALMAVLLGKTVLVGVTAADGVVIGGGLGLSMLVLGYRLRAWPRGTVVPAPAGATSG